MKVRGGGGVAAEPARSTEGKDGWDSRKKRESRGVFNWIWLSPLPRFDARAVLLVAEDPDLLAPRLKPHFSTVHTLAAGVLSQDRSQSKAGPGPEHRLLPFARDSLDCVVLWSFPESTRFSGTPVPSRVRLLTDCRRVLKSGGCLYLGQEGRRLSFALKRTLQRAGFHGVRIYYDRSRQGNLEMCLPANRQLILRSEAWRTESPPIHIRMVRRGLIWGGLHGLLFRRRIFLASA